MSTRLNLTESSKKVINETVLTTCTVHHHTSYQILQELFGIDRSRANKERSAARLAPRDGSEGKSKQTRALNTQNGKFSRK